MALALIPEAIAFFIIAGVDPKVGLYASFCIAVLTSIFGGRPGMISAATAATALLMVTLVKEHGLPYLMAATVLTGVLQVVAGLAKIGNVMRFVSRSVMTGFVNALAILIFMAQLPEFKGAGLTMYVMVAAALAIIYLLPRLTTLVPSPLVAIIVLTTVSIGTFSWTSIKNLRIHPKSTSLVMIATVIVVVWSHNLALGVGIGVLLSALFFARKVAAVIRVRSTDDPSTSTRTYTVHGNVFFASAPEFIAGFNLKEPASHVVIDVSHAHFWDLTSVDALDKVVLKFRRAGTHVEVLGLNEASATLVDRLALHGQPGAHPPPVMPLPTAKAPAPKKSRLS